MTLPNYIKRYYFNNCLDFAKAVGVTRNIVAQWAKRGTMVEDHVMFNPYRRLPTPKAVLEGLIDLKAVSSESIYLIASVSHTTRESP